MNVPAVVMCPCCGTELNMNVTIDESNIKRVANSVVNASMENLATSIGAQRVVDWTQDR